jgi:hypothetical protein
VGLVELRPKHRQGHIATAVTARVRDGKVSEKRDALWLRDNSENFSPIAVTKIDSSERAQFDCRWLRVTA